MLYFLVSALVVLFISYAIGTVILGKIKIEGIHFSTPVGFLVFVSLLQIFQYIYRFFGFNNIVFHYCFLITIVIGLLIYVINYKEMIRGLKKIYKYKWELTIAVLTTIVLLFLFSNVDITIKTTDSIFYTKYVGTFIDPYLVPSNYSVQYDYQVFYNIISSLKYWTGFLSKIGLFTEVLIYPFMTWTFAFINYFILSLTMVNIISEVYRKYKFSICIFVATMVVLVCSLLNSWTIITPYYGNSFRRIAICYLMYFMFCYIKNRSKDILFLTMVLFQSMISLSSSGLFLSIILLYSFMTYSIWYKRTGFIGELLILAVFPVIFAVIFMPNLFLPVIAVYTISSLLFLANKINLLEQFCFKFGKYFVILVPIIFCVLPYIPMFGEWFNVVEKDFWGRPVYDFVPDLLRFSGYASSAFTIIFNASFWIITAFVVFKTIKEKNFFAFTILITILTFFNPFVHDVVYKFFTNVVYFRITDIFYNPLILSFLFLSFCLSFKSKIAKIGVTLIYCILILSAFWIYRFNVKTISNDDFNYIYHTTNGDIELFNELDQYLIENDYKDEYFVISQAYGTGMYSRLKINNLFNWQTHYLGNLDETNFSTVFYRREPNSDDYVVDYSQACKLAYERNAEYFIIDAQYNWQLEAGLWPCIEKVLEVNNYRVFKARYDLWEYNIEQGYAEDTRE